MMAGEIVITLVFKVSYQFVTSSKLNRSGMFRMLIFGGEPLLEFGFLFSYLQWHLVPYRLVEFFFFCFFFAKVVIFSSFV